MDEAELDEEVAKTEAVDETPTEHLNTSKDSEGENVDAIKKFIEDQEKEIVDSKTACNTVENVEHTAEPVEPKESQEIKVENDDPEKKIQESPHEPKKEEEDELDTIQETMEVATNVMDMILDVSETKFTEKNIKTEPKANLASVEKIAGNSMALSVGSKVEAKDYGEFWHTAEITEVDFEEMEVLVHYEDDNKKHDEWINVSSPRLRPRGSKPLPKPPTTPKSEPVTIKTEPSSPPVTPAPVAIKEEPKEKSKVTFEVGERCLARWRDNRRFIATVSADLENGKFEIIFDDGVKWTCNAVRLSKLRDSYKKDPLTVDTGGPIVSSTPSPVIGLGPSHDGSTAIPTTPVGLPFNTHLFDPARDYLSSKSERREMKRKLNIKEIFNIGQKKKKVETPKSTAPPKPKPPTPKVVKEKPKVVKKKPEPKVKPDIPDAVASIIGTMPKESPPLEANDEVKEEIKSEDEQTETEVVKIEIDDTQMDVDDIEAASSETLSASESQYMKIEDDSLLAEAKLEKFEEQDEGKHEEVLDRIKEAIIKLEDGINKAEIKTEVEPKPEANEQDVELKKALAEEPKKNVVKNKKVSKVKLKREKKVKKQVEKVKSELEEMKKQVEKMRKQVSEEMAKKRTEMPESVLLPGEWCCKWVNNQPVGQVSEIEHETKVDVNNKPVLPRRSVQVEDKRLPPGWTKHMVRRSLGSSAGKWDVILMSPDNRRLHTKTEMKHYLESNPDKSLMAYEAALMDFGIHLKLTRRMGWYTTTPDGAPEAPDLPVGTLGTTSPLIKKKHLSLKKNKLKDKKKKLGMKRRVPSAYRYDNYLHPSERFMPGSSGDLLVEREDMPPENVPPLEAGFVYVGSLKVQIIENLLRCPAEGCFKNFRNNTLLKMHIKHYHRELRKMLGATPKVLDLAYARTRPTAVEMRRLKLEKQHKRIKVKFTRPPKKTPEVKQEVNKEFSVDVNVESLVTPVKDEPKPPKIPRSQDSPKLRTILSKPVNLLSKPTKRPKVLLPVRKSEPTETSLIDDIKEEDINIEEITATDPIVPISDMDVLDFETAISTHTVTRPTDIRRKGEKKKKFASISKASEDDEWYGMNSDVETRSSYPRSGTPDSKMDQKLISSESNEEQKEPRLPNYMYTECGERIKIVHMKREEIINCHCGFREEDGLMVQCELCLCWQHALCHNIQRESEVPEKYTCSICLNPRRGRRSQRFLHDQDRLYEGLLPGAKPCETLRRSHELSGNLHRIEDALQALRVKYYVATKKDHPKLYLWASDWESSEIALTQEKLNSDYSDLSIMISSIGKENLPVKPEDPQSLEDQGVGGTPERYSQKDHQLGSQALLSGLLSSPGGASLDLPNLPITTTELEKLAKSVEAEQEAQRLIIPQPEAAIENSACRERLLRHMQRCQALIDARLDSVEAHIAELESQDPSFEDDETADYFPRTKQTIQMLMRDLDTMEELGVIT